MQSRLQSIWPESISTLSIVNFAWNERNRSNMLQGVTGIWPISNYSILIRLYVFFSDASDIHLYDIDIHEESHREGLALVQHFNKIKNLTLDVRQDFKTSTQDFIFDKGITPILLSHGNNLTFIMFTFVRDLDLGLLASSCSNLEQLRLQFNIYSNVTTTRFQVRH